MKNYKVFANDFDMGIFEAESEDAALEAYAQEAGYESLADMEAQLDSKAKYEVVECECEGECLKTKTKEENKMKKFTIYVNDFNMGIFEGEDEAAALEAFAQEAGYQSMADMDEQLADADEQVESKPDSYEVVEVEENASDKTQEER